MNKWIVCWKNGENENVWNKQHEGLTEFKEAEKRHLWFSIYFDCTYLYIEYQSSDGRIAEAVHRIREEDLT